jgi:hypothetical protein
MQFISLIVPAVLAFATTCNAWAQAADGTWIANNVFYNIDGGMSPFLRLENKIKLGCSKLIIMGFTYS